jgi:uncharacterized glyoxalase superfamily protein PhnB
VPVLAYDDVGAALEWLSRVFGFTETLRFADGDGVVRWAEMRYGTGYVMLTEPDDLPFTGRVFGQRAGRARTVVFTDDVDAHRIHTMDAGRLPVTEATEQPEGLREYDALDPGGHVWTFSQHLADVAAAAWGAIGSSDL